MPVIVRVAAELRQPWHQDPKFIAWETPPGSVPWLEVILDLERKTPGYQGQGIAVSSIYKAFNAMRAKSGTFKPVGEQACSEQMELLGKYGFTSKIGPRWASTTSGKRAVALMGQRGGLWGVLNKLLESGKASKEDVLQAMVAGYKKGSEQELLGIVEPPTPGV